MYSIFYHREQEKGGETRMREEMRGGGLNKPGYSKQHRVSRAEYNNNVSVRTENFGDRNRYSIIWGGAGMHCLPSAVLYASQPTCS